MKNNKQELHEIVQKIESLDCIDIAEHLYDGIKTTKREIRRLQEEGGQININPLKDFLWSLESSQVIDLSGEMEDQKERLKKLIKILDRDQKLNDLGI
jgi:hypothetical protein